MPIIPPGAKVTQFSRDMVNRIAGSLSFFSSQSSQNAAPQQRRKEPWFGPGAPMRPLAPKADVAGRAYDYPASYNMGTRPRQYEGISFEMLEGLADGSDMVRLAIETRKDQMSKLGWKILPKMAPGQELRGPPDDRCALVQEALAFPDRRESWHMWQRRLIEEQLVTDAATIYCRPDLSGRPYAFEILHGRTIMPLLDSTGRMPHAPAPAFQQILHGMPAIDYSADELIYAPRNPRNGRAYGCSAVQQIIMTVNIAIKREISKLNFYTEGNIPEALVSVPKDWDPDKIRRWQEIWDTMLSDSMTRRRMKFVPGDMNYQPTRADQSLQDPYDEWLARVIMFAFSLPALPFVKMQNRSTAETANETALEDGLQPMMIWFKTSIMDDIVQRKYGYDDLEFVWDDIDQVDPAAQQERDMSMIQIGVKSVDEVRAGMGLAPIGMKHAIWGIGPNGIIFVEDLLKAQAAGLTQLQPPPPPMMGGLPGAPGLPPAPGAPAAPIPLTSTAVPGGSPDAIHGELVQPAPAAPTVTAADVLAMIPPKLLAAVGLGPEGPGGRHVDITSDEEVQSDPLRRHVPHPMVLQTLRAAERSQQSRGKR